MKFDLSVFTGDDECIYLFFFFFLQTMLVCFISCFLSYIVFNFVHFLYKCEVLFVRYTEGGGGGNLIFLLWSSFFS